MREQLRRERGELPERHRRVLLDHGDRGVDEDLLLQRPERQPGDLPGGERQLDFPVRLAA
jgi:hypothetical protein